MIVPRALSPEAATELSCIINHHVNHRGPFSVNMKILKEAYPSRGTNDWQNLSLAVGGNRPEPIVSIKDQVVKFADKNGLDVWFDWEQYSVTFQRKTK